MNLGHRLQAWTVCQSEQRDNFGLPNFPTNTYITRTFFHIASPLDYDMSWRASLVFPKTFNAVAAI